MSLNRKSMGFLCGLLVAVGLTVFGVSWAAGQFQAVSHSKVRIVKEYPHNSNSFTQGLLFHEGELFEGTGQYGESKLLKVDLSTGQLTGGVALPKQYFGEGIAVAGGELFQLTWKSRVGFVYDPKTFQLLRTVRYAGEGWGLTFDGESLILSDGSATLRFLDPQTFDVKRRVTVHEGRRSIKNLNELEFIQGEVWANIWYEDQIARINPQNGQIVGWINVASLKPRSLRFNRDAVCNGIAYDEATRKLYITGKNWPSLYEVELVPAR